jgi:GTP-binding protein HflX
LEDLEISNKPVIRIFNKADRFPDKDLLRVLASRFGAIAISALDKTTLFALLEKIESLLPGKNFSVSEFYANKETID